jgi:hypothetical protein
MDFDPQASLTTFLGERQQLDPLYAVPVMVAGFWLYRGGAAVANATAEEMSAWVDRATLGGRLAIADLRGTLDDNGHTWRLLQRPDVHLVVVPAGEQRSIPEVRRLTTTAEAQGVGYSILINKRQRRASSAMASEAMRAFWPAAMTTEVPDLADVGVAESRLQPVTLAVPRSRVSESIGEFARIIVERGVI